MFSSAIPKTHLPNVNSHAKFKENQEKNDKDREQKPISNVNNGP